MCTWCKHMWTMHNLQGFWCVSGAVRMVQGDSSYQQADAAHTMPACVSAVGMDQCAMPDRIKRGSSAGQCAPP